jgi:hypothetical protein
MYSQPTPKDKILPIEEFKKLPLAEMLTKLPVIPIGGGSKLTIKAEMPQIVCADGTTLSVQVGEYTYCSPIDNKGPYRSVEVGFPSVEPPEIWRQYAEDPDHPTDTVYAYVPIELVSFFIARHGGIDIERTFDGFTYELK